MNSDYLFVYGTLQQDLDNEMSKFLSQYSEVVSKGFILGKLYKISWFPGAISSDVTSEHVYGTVYKLKHISETFKVLDDYEGFDVEQPNESLFKRKITTVFLENGNSIDAWVYLYNGSVTDVTHIISGDFLTFSDD